jgi:hypothetical protein
LILKISVRLDPDPKKTGKSQRTKIESRLHNTFGYLTSI